MQHPFKRSSSLMKDTVKLSFKEEALNASLHGICSLFLLLILPYLSVYSFFRGGMRDVVGIGIYVFCMFCMFTFSTIYHIMPYHTPWKTVTRKLDHIAILLAIAGTYTPICLSLLGRSGYWILALEWSLALCGILLKAFSDKAHPVISMVLYVLMGWLAVFFLPAIIQNTSRPFLLWIIAGGLFYTIGIYFYSKEHKYYHVIWHVLIILAFLCQFVGIVFYL